MRHQKNLEAKFSDQISDNLANMSTLSELSKKRAASKGQVTLQLKYLAPFLELKGRDAVKGLTEAGEFHDKLHEKVKAFRLAHEQYTEQLLLETEEKDLEKTLNTLDEYHNEVNSKYHDTTKKFDAFKIECEIVECKDDLESSIDDYSLVEKEIRLQFDKHGSKSVEELQGCAEVKHIAAEELKSRLI